MRFFIVLIAVLWLTLSASAAAQRNLVGITFDARVTSIIDGDTVDVVRVGEQTVLRVRIFGVDAPERGEPFYAVATRATRTMLFDRRVTLTGRDLDQYGRLVANVTVGGADVSVSLLQSGVVCHFTAFSSDANFAAAQAQARRDGRGFWASGAQRPRCATAVAAPSAPVSRAGAQAIATELHGNVNSRVYHRSSCPNYTCQNCTRVFQSEADAKAAGFRPAGDCH